MDKNNQPGVSFWVPLFVVVLGAFAAILNNSSVNVALPKIMSIFGVSEDEAQWVLTAYMLTSGVVIPVTGYLGDVFGAKRTYLLALTVFMAGSFVCGMAWNNNSLIAARVVQGIGGGAIIPVSMAIVYRIVPRQKIGTALGVWGMAAVTAPAIGPTLGGYVVDHLSWRFLFTMNVPVALLALMLGSMLLQENKVNKDLKFDFWGFLTSATGCFTLLLALSQGHQKGWGSFYIVSLLTFSFFILLLFVVIELNSRDPMLDLRLFKNSVFSISVLGGSLLNMGLFGGVFLIPIFTQNLMGKTPMETGLMLMPAALVTVVMMPLSGALFDRIGPRAVTFIGLLTLTLGTWEFKNLSADTTVLHITLIASLRSLGMGLALMPMTTAGMNTIPGSLVGRASSLNNVCRQVAGSFGIAILTTIMQGRQALHLARLSDSLAVDSPAVPLFMRQVGDIWGASAGSGQGTALSLLSGLVTKQSMILAIDDTFIAAALFIGIAIPFAFFLGQGKKQQQPVLSEKLNQ